MKLYAIRIFETFIDGTPDRVYRRFHRDGRMCPEGLFYLDSRLSADGSR